MNLPVDFEEKARAAKSASGGGYPVQLSAADLMRNFVYAVLDVDPSLVNLVTGQGGHQSRKLKIPAAPEGADPMALTSTGGDMQWVKTLDADSNKILQDRPKTGTYVLGVVNGKIQWIATEAC